MAMQPAAANPAGVCHTGRQTRGPTRSQHTEQHMPRPACNESALMLEHAALGGVLICFHYGQEDTCEALFQTEVTKTDQGAVLSQQAH